MSFKKFARQLKQQAAKKSRAFGFVRMSDNQVAEALRPSMDAFLFSSEWRALRSKVVQTYGGKCMCCGVIPKDPCDINVDHIKPRLHFPELALDFNNLQVLCWRCNKRKGNQHYTDYRK